MPDSAVLSRLLQSADDVQRLVHMCADARDAAPPNGGAGFAAMCFGALAVRVYWRRRKTLVDATSRSQEMA